MENKWSLYKREDTWFVSHDNCEFYPPKLNYPCDRDAKCFFCKEIIPISLMVQWRLLENES